ncbi:uncharacterized protein LOC130728566 [Lotus japonicus]|uniref:uncharacterized protein LOC130728566 n=1 Tax=Lotus japonicus TaxID=34305 RepID=UPI002589B7FE|nr:uncharacterized protein LOC130728566 [Lotus japonicus]
MAKGEEIRNAILIKLLKVPQVFAMSWLLMHNSFGMLKKMKIKIKTANIILIKATLPSDPVKFLLGLEEERESSCRIIMDDASVTRGCRLVEHHMIRGDCDDADLVIESKFIT